MLSVPTCEALAFWIILRKPREYVGLVEKTPDCAVAVIDLNNVRRLSKPFMISESDIEYNQLAKDDTELKGFKEKIRFIPSLMKFIIPLVLVYLFEYIINSGLVSGF